MENQKAHQNSLFLLECFHIYTHRPMQYTDFLFGLSINRCSPARSSNAFHQRLSIVNSEHISLGEHLSWRNFVDLVKLMSIFSLEQSNIPMNKQKSLMLNTSQFRIRLSMRRLTVFTDRILEHRKLTIDCSLYDRISLD